MQVEIHITTTPLANDQLKDFVSFCEKVGSKPIIIELEGEKTQQQPMISKTVDVEDKAAMVFAIDDLKSQFIRAGYGVARVKLEVDINDKAGGQALFPDYLGGYYEWHGEVDDSTCDLIRNMTDRQDVHISQNALKDRSGRRMLTMRQSNSKYLLMNIHNIVM